MAVWSVVNFSQVPFDWRLDAEYFKPQYLELDNLLSHANVKLWGNLEGDFITGPFGSAFTVDNYVESSPYRYIRGKDVKPFFLMDDDNAYMPEQAFNNLKKYSLNPDDLLVSVVGTLGNVAVVDADVGQAIFSCKSTAFRSKSIDPYYLCAYLNSNIGQAYFQRKPRGAIQTGLNLDDLYTIPIYIPESKKEEEISNLVKGSWKQLKKSKALYAEAEALLLHELGLDTLDLSTQKTYVANFSETVEGDRLDSEYFQPKYYRVLDVLKSLNIKQLLPLGVLLESITNGQTPLHHNLSEGDITFLTAEHILDFRINYDSDKRILKEHHEQKLQKTQLQQKDLLITIKGRIGNAAVVESLSKPVNINQDVALLRLRAEYHPYYIAGFINSLAGKALTEQIGTGQINPFLGLGNLQKLMIPIFEQSYMDKIGEKVEQKVYEACQTQKEAEQLLEQAKHRVEQMILGEHATDEYPS